MTLRLFTVAAILAIAPFAAAGQGARTASLTITNAHLVAQCLDGKAVDAGTRRWEVSAPVSLTFTMKNEPRPGIENAAPGSATIAFTPEDGHKYEIEVQTVASANSFRVWPKGKWAPAVRDRTSDRIVNSPPQWTEAHCLK